MTTIAQEIRAAVDALERRMTHRMDDLERSLGLVAAAAHTAALPPLAGPAADRTAAARGILARLHTQLAALPSGPGQNWPDGLVWIVREIERTLHMLDSPPVEYQRTWIGQDPPKTKTPH